MCESAGSCEGNKVMFRRTGNSMKDFDFARVIVLASKEKSFADFCVCTCCYWCSWWVAESSWWHSTGTSCWDYENACIYSSRETGASAESSRLASTDNPREHSLVVWTSFFYHLLFTLLISTLSPDYSYFEYLCPESTPGCRVGQCTLD